MTTEYKVYEPTNSGTAEDELRRRAVKRLRAKAGFWTHLVVNLVANAFLVASWFFSGAGFFWPIFPIAGWGDRGGGERLGCLWTRSGHRGAHSTRDESAAQVT